MVELVDTWDLKSHALTRRAGSTPARGTSKYKHSRESSIHKQSQGTRLCSNFVAAEMASILKIGPYQYRAQIRRKGFKPQTKTFANKEEADTWASTIDAEMKHGVFLDRKEAERAPLAEALGRCGRELSGGKKGEKRELQRIAFLKREPNPRRNPRRRPGGLARQQP